MTRVQGVDPLCLLLFQALYSLVLTASRDYRPYLQLLQPIQLCARTFSPPLKIMSRRLRRPLTDRDNLAASARRAVVAARRPMDMVAAPLLRQQVLYPRASSPLVQAAADFQEVVFWVVVVEALPEEGEECHSFHSHCFVGARPQRQWQFCPSRRLAGTARARAREPSVGLHVP